MNNMKKILLALLFVLMLGVQNVQAQDSTDTVTIPKTELQAFFTQVDSLQTDNADLRTLLGFKKLEIRKLEFIVEQDSLLLGFKDQRIRLLEDEIQSHTDYITHLEKRGWRQSKVLWFLNGAATILVSSIVLQNINSSGGN